MCRRWERTTRVYFPAFWGIQKIASRRFTRSEFFATTEDAQMGEILAVGITHYPPLAGRDQMMSWILKRMLENPHLPEKWRRPENWPEAMREEWGTDEG